MEEIWKELEELDLYEVSTLSNIRNKKTKLLLKPYTNKLGYKYVALINNNIRKSYSLHRLVALVFIPNLENKAIVNHKDGNKQNPKLENLEWVNHSENSNHAVLIGKIKTKSVIQYDLCKNKLNEFNSIKEAATYLKISPSTVSNLYNKNYSLPRKYLLEWKLNIS